MRVATIRPQSEWYTASTAALALGSMVCQSRSERLTRPGTPVSIVVAHVFRTLGTNDNKVFFGGVSILALPVRFSVGGAQNEIHVAGLPGRAGHERRRARALLRRVCAADTGTQRQRSVFKRQPVAPGCDCNQRAR